MQKRFNTDNFQIALVKTEQDTIIKFVIAFVLGHHLAGSSIVSRKFKGLYGRKLPGERSRLL